MKHLFRIAIPSLLLLFGLTSCEQSVDYQRVLRNSSSHDLIISRLDSVQFYHNESLVDSFLILSGEQTEFLAFFDEKGRVSDYANCDYNHDSLVVRIANQDSLQLNFDINDASRWYFAIINEDKYGGGECECQIEVLDENIE